MKRNITIGIDIGTSYSKGIVLCSQNGVLSTCRITTKHCYLDEKQNVINADSYWISTLEILNKLSKYVNKDSISGIGISAISTNLTVFEDSYQGRSCTVPYWIVPKKNEGILFKDLNKWRFKLLENYSIKSKLINPCITDLVGFINWKLSGNLTINNKIPFFNDIKKLIDKTVVFRKPIYCDVIQKIGAVTSNQAVFLNKAWVFGGCSDSIASIFGAGIRKQKTGIYLGTFGSIFEISETFKTDLISSVENDFPIKWKLSIPKLGSSIEQFCKKMLPDSNFEKSIKILLKYAMKSEPGAEGNYFTLPRWNNQREIVGSLKYFGSGQNPNSKENVCRAFFESVAYAIDYYNCKFDNEIVICGGGTKSKDWLGIISSVLDKKIIWRNYNWDAIGTAEIAQVGLNSEYNQKIGLSNSIYIKPPNKTNINKVKQNVKAFYHEFNKQ